MEANETLQPDSRGTVYALLIGINDYESESVRRLQFAVADVVAFREVLGERLQLRQENCILLTHPCAGAGPIPRRGEVLRALAQFSKAPMGPDDTFLLYFAGHGFAVADKSYLLTVDSDPAVPELLAETAVSLETVTRFTRQVTAGQQLLVLDACRNNPTTLGRDTGVACLDVAMARDIAALARPVPAAAGTCLPARATLSACWEGQASYECAARGHGWFSHHLLESLRNHPSDLLDVSEMVEQVCLRMRERAWRDLPEAGGQTPHVVIEGRPVRLRLAPLHGEAANTSSSSSVAAPRVVPHDSAGSTIPHAHAPRTDPTKGPQQSSPRPAISSATQDSCTNELGICFRLISSGQFVLGASWGDSAASTDEQPRTPLTIPGPFWAATFPLTNAVVRRFLESASPDDDPRFVKLRNDRSFASQVRRGTVDDNLPAVEVSHEDAEILCAWLKSLDGREYRLPVEAEWEYMARAGTTGPYWWGPESLAQTHAVFATAGPAPANAQRANAWGLIDVLGNVAEWTVSAYASFGSGSAVKAAQSRSGEARVVRGGSWRAKTIGDLRVSRRKSMFRKTRADDLGVRIVCDIDEESR